MASPRSVRTRWLVAWLGGIPIGVANGVLREATYGRRASPMLAHQLSALTVAGAFAGYFVALQRRWPIASRRDALHIGGVWLALTVAFEFGFGRLVTKQTWEELLADYNVAEGRTWPLVLVWLATGPELVRRAMPAREP